MKTAVKLLIAPFAFFALFQSIGSADESVRPQIYFRARGYVAVSTTTHPLRRALRDLPGLLPWPVVFQDAAHTIAQNFVNFQDYDGASPYFHQGCDLRSAGDSEVVAPVDGILEGGYYGYTNLPTGAMQKQWQPWNGQTHADPYFELAIVTEDGYRFEMHHVDSQKLPAFTVQALNQGHVRVKAGTVIGKVNAWAFPGYSHVHYNIIRPDGVFANPEYYSIPLPDHTAPAILGVFALTPDGKATALRPGEVLPFHPAQFVVASTESHDRDAYVQTPPIARIHFASGGSFAWNFRQWLVGPDGHFPDIRQVFDLDGLALPDGRRLETFGQYGKGMFLIRLPVGAADHGEFEIALADTTGNSSVFRAALAH